MSCLRRSFFFPTFIIGLAIALALLIASTPSSQQLGQTHYVNNTDPTCGGQSPCYATIQAAVNAALPGDTVEIQAGIYPEKVTISGKNNTAGATEASRIVIEADPLAAPGDVVITGSTQTCTNGFAFRLSQSKFITIRGLTITGTGGQAIELMGGNNQNTAIHIESNRIFNNGSGECNGGITIARGNPETLIVNNLIYANGRNGITFIDADGGPHYIIENTIHGNNWSGVRVARSHEVFLVNNSITQNGVASGSTGGRFGISREGSTSPQPQGIHLLNNLICGNRLGQIDGPALDGTDSGNLTPTGGEGPGVTASPGCEIPANVYDDLNGIDALPNTGDDDFQLAANSPAIDRGMDPRTLGLGVLFNPILEADFFSDAARPEDGNGNGTTEFDIGALEFSVSNDVPVANAGADQTVDENALVNLNGASSFDPDGHTISFQWTQTAGPTVALSSSSSFTPTFVAPEVTADTTLTFELLVSDGLASSTDTVNISIRNVPPPNQAPLVNAGADLSITLPASASLNGSVSDDGLPNPPEQTTTTWSQVSGPGTVTFDNASAATTTATFSTSGSYVLRLTADDGDLSAVDDVTVTVDSGLPPDPGTVAPPVDPTAASDLASTTEFLYTGPDPIQTGVAPGTIVPKRAAVLRGKVLTGDGSALGGVSIAVHNHPEFGSTLSRDDGAFDMAVNGGDVLTLSYQKSGFLPAQRQVTVPWQEFALLPDVMMIPLDAQVTAIDLNSAAPVQVARGSSVTDSDGTRQATLLFSQGTAATMTLPDGTTQPLTNLNVRATEYTVGTGGLAAMPGQLPPSSGYTYAVEFSVDAALAAGAKQVTFNQPVIHHVENFLNFPIGGIVPVGFYDREKAAWVPSENGRVIKILSISGGMAELDTDGDGLVDSGAALGVTAPEREQLATLYQAGVSLWRVPVTHFSPYDCNWPYGPPDTAKAPEQSPAQVENTVQDPNSKCGSIIECQNRTLGESVNLTGTPFRLHYQSDRVPGRRAANTLKIPLSGTTVPDTLKRIEVEIFVAGRMFTETFPADPNQTYTFTWDGHDAYGRKLQGAQPVTVRTGYVYGAVYRTPIQLARSFAAAGGAPISGSRARGEFTFWQQQRLVVGAWDARAQGLGGWTLDVQHAFNPVGQVLYLGNGARRTGEDIGKVITTVAGNGSLGYSGDGGPATSASLNLAHSATADNDGNLFIADTSNNAVRKVTPDGIITTVADAGDGLNNPTKVVVDENSNLFIVNQSGHRIVKMTPEGVITTVAGTGVGGSSGDGGPATSARLSFPLSAALDGQGNLFIADEHNNRIRKVDRDGIITTVVGNGSQGGTGDGGPALEATLTFPSDVVVDRDGNLFIADWFSQRIRKVTPDGIISTVVGTGVDGFSGESGPGTSMMLDHPFGVGLDGHGNVYVSDEFNNRVWRLTPDGMLATAVGGGSLLGDNGPATSSNLNSPLGMTVDGHGNLYIADFRNHRIRKVFSVFPGFTGNEIPVPSEDGGELYVFDSRGKHLHTLDTITGAIRYQFGYDAAGFLATVTDGDGNVTTVERGGAGNPTAIVAPGGQRTAFTLDANGYLATISDPAANNTQLVYSATGLLTSMRDARNALHQFTYDGDGLLSRHEDPAGGFTTLARTESTNSFEASLTTALGRQNKYRVENLPTGASRRINTDPTGLQTVEEIGTDGSRKTTLPDGTITTVVQGPDPRFGMQAPLAKSLTVRAPSGLLSTVTTNRTVNLANPNDLLSLTSLIDTTTLNGRTFTSSYNAAQRRWTNASPLNRQRFTVLDAQGRALQDQTAGLAPVNFTYDTLGRLSTVTQGTGTAERLTTIDYDPKNRISSITDPAGRSVGFSYDLADRVTTQTLPDGREISYTYDGNGNITSITPPSRPQHSFAYTPVNLEQNYTPPNVGAGTNSTIYSYNLDKQLTQVLRPDGATIALDYDTGGRLSAMTHPGGVVNYAYHPTKGTVSSITSPGTIMSYNYDGTLLSSHAWSGPVTGIVSFTYDNNFRITSESINGGHTTNFTYDTDGLLTGVGALTLNRNAQNGLLTGTTLGSVTDALTYNSFGEPVSYQASYSGATLFNTQFSRDSLGRITQKTELIDGATTTFDYSYDLAGRLTEVKKNGAVVSTYNYDGNGNRLSLTTSTGTVNGTYDDQDRLLSYGNNAYTYTANGELQSKTTSGQTTNYNYDVFGNLISVTLPGGTQIEYIVDGRNRRIGKKINSVQTQGFLYQDQLRPVAELDGSNTVVSRFVYGTKANVPDYMVKGGVTYRIISDHLGNPRVVMNSTTGIVVQRIDYDEFGNVILDTNPGFQPFAFAGGLYDQHTKLTRFGARDYDAETGRWTVKDPILFAGRSANLYDYALNNPIDNVDPDGQLILEATIIFIGVQAAVIGGTYVVVQGVRLLTNAINALNCDPRGTSAQEINQAFKYAAAGAFAPAVPLAIIEAGAVAGPAAASAVIQNPQLIPPALDFIQGALLPGPPPSSFSGAAGFLGSAAINEISKRLK